MTLREFAAMTLAFSNCCLAAQFPMRYAGNLSELAAGARKSVAPGIEARGGKDGVTVTLQGRDRGGNPWRILTGVTGGLGWTVLYTADFDADGQTDFLIGDHFPGVGACINYTRVTVVTFGEDGRPRPWRLETQMPRSADDAFPFRPIGVVRSAKDRRVAEFIVTGCSRERGEFEEARLDAGALAGRFAATGTRADRLEALLGSEFGCEPEPCGKGPQTMLASGKSLDGWPTGVVFDSPGDAGREIDLRSGQLAGALSRLLRYGYPVRMQQDGGGLMLWAASTSAEAPAQTVMEIDASAVRKVSIPAKRSADGCIDFVYRETATLRQCRGDAAAWTRVNGGSRESLDPADGRRVTGSHTAMQHTSHWDLRFERPPGAKWSSIRGRVELPENLNLVHWSGGEVAVHDADGSLIAAGVKLPIEGADLLFRENGLVLGRAGQSYEVRGRLRWRRQVGSPAARE